MGDKKSGKAKTRTAGKIHSRRNDEPPMPRVWGESKNKLQVV